MAVGELTETVMVAGASPIVDVQNARQAITFQGDRLSELPTPRNLNSLLELTPGISSNYRADPAFGQPVSAWAASALSATPASTASTSETPARL